MKRNTKAELPIDIVSKEQLLEDLGLSHVRSKDPMIEDLILEQGEGPCPIALETRNDSVIRQTEVKGTELVGKSALETAMKDAYEATEIVRSGSPVE